VVCSNALDRTVKEFGITEPGKILDKVRELVVETFEKSESEVKDGMDISLCLINGNDHKIRWAGANNPLWYIEQGIIKEIKANKQPIGKIDSPLPFTTHDLQLSSNDKIYLFTDGYADQFGGDKGKKFKYKNLQEMILANSDLPMKDQKEILGRSMESWKGNLEQIDDILIIGIKI
jgi:serine phosphatase RsbU (regulator of sigma subunit)